MSVFILLCTVKYPIVRLGILFYFYKSSFVSLHTCYPDIRVICGKYATPYIYALMLSSKILRYEKLFINLYLWKQDNLHQTIYVYFSEAERNVKANIFMLNILTYVV
jgi:hypothetical protein